MTPDSNPCGASFDIMPTLRHALLIPGDERIRIETSTCIMLRAARLQHLFSA